MPSFWKEQSSSAEDMQEEDMNNYNGLQSLTKPELSRSSCFSSQSIRSFLKKSRLYADDTLREKLNSQRRNDRNGCSNVINTILIPAWSDRLEMIQYCDEQAKKVKKEIDDYNIHDEAKQHPEFNLRVNPYAEEDFEDLKNKRYESVYRLQNWVQNEIVVEKIVVGKSLEILNDRCPRESVKQLQNDLKSENFSKLDL
ncbi:Mix23 protein [Saccharomycopsis crataegensis]|uniref:Mix23 protein n=1 Tax=Saccharomycopsis crataegensis TaxID=43959 RepID=A0AAV5QIA3_9ASCO|nr:Mix23 protein [Saccharomycopsis crataegensis]